MGQKNKVSFWSTTIGKTVQVAIYVSISAVIGTVVSAIAQNPMLFGVVTPMVNIVLVLVKNILDKNTPNLPSSVQ